MNIYLQHVSISELHDWVLRAQSPVDALVDAAALAIVLGAPSDVAWADHKRAAQAATTPDERSRVETLKSWLGKAP
jgi:hypothetical protein